MYMYVCNFFDICQKTEKDYVTRVKHIVNNYPVIK